MTPKRKKYLAGISKEERVIRCSLYMAKNSLRICKKHAFRYGGRKPPEEFAPTIKHLKTVIKNLKKQLPAPRKGSFTCLACGWDGLESAMNFCFRCGQRLR